MPVRLPVDRHDDAVAIVSHAPQLVSSLLAARLVDAPDHATDLAGQGLRDTTRIAASDPALWIQILSANADRVLPVLSDLRDDLDAVVEALTDPTAPGAQRALADLLAAGNDGVARIPGKHGMDLRTTTLVVLVDDRPGQIARLLTEIGEEGINLEDLRLDHSAGQDVGMVEISVLPGRRQQLVDYLSTHGWKVLQ